MDPPPPRPNSTDATASVCALCSRVADDSEFAEREVATTLARVCADGACLRVRQAYAFDGDAMAAANDYAARAFATAPAPTGICISRKCIRLERITAENVNAALELSVTPPQVSYVGTVSDALVLAHFFTDARPLLARDVTSAQPVGFVMYSYTNAGTVNLLRLLVDASVQGRRYGSALLDTFVVLARHLGAQGIRLSVHPSAKDALELYRRRGFTIATERNPRTLHHEARLVFTTTTTPSTSPPAEACV